jgi:hypothetical protein
LSCIGTIAAIATRASNCTVARVATFRGVVSNRVLVESDRATIIEVESPTISIAAVASIASIAARAPTGSRAAVAICNKTCRGVATSSTAASSAAVVAIAAICSQTTQCAVAVQSVLRQKNGCTGNIEAASQSPAASASQSSTAAMPADASITALAATGISGFASRATSSIAGLASSVAAAAIATLSVVGAEGCEKELVTAAASEHATAFPVATGPTHTSVATICTRTGVTSRPGTGFGVASIAACSAGARCAGSSTRTSDCRIRVDRTGGVLHAAGGDVEAATLTAAADTARAAITTYCASPSIAALGRIAFSGARRASRASESTNGSVGTRAALTAIATLTTDGGVITQTAEGNWYRAGVINAATLTDTASAAVAGVAANSAVATLTTIATRPGSTATASSGSRSTTRPPSTTTAAVAAQGCVPVNGIAVGREGTNDEQGTALTIAALTTAGTCTTFAASGGNSPRPTSRNSLPTRAAYAALTTRSSGSTNTTSSSLNKVLIVFVVRGYDRCALCNKHRAALSISTKSTDDAEGSLGGLPASPTLAAGTGPAEVVERSVSASVTVSA